MNTPENEATTPRFREICEACGSAEYAKGFGLRLLKALTDNKTLPPEAIPATLKDQLAQLPHPDKREAAAFEKICRTVFKVLLKNMLLKPKGFKVGFVCAVFLDWDGRINGPSTDVVEREILYSFLIPALGLGTTVDETSIGKLQDVFAKHRWAYSHALLFPQELRADFFKGLERGNEFATLDEKIFTKGPDSTKVYMLIAALGKYNRLLRSTYDLYRFIDEGTFLNLKFDWDSFKSACKDISWRGARFLRSDRCKNLGVGVKPAAP